MNGKGFQQLVHDCNSAIALSSKLLNSTIDLIISVFVARSRRRITKIASLVCIISLQTAGSQIANAADDSDDLARWKQTLWQQAKSQGISAATFTAALGNRQPNYKLPWVRTKADWARMKQAAKRKPPVKGGAEVLKDGLPPSCHRPRQKEFLFPTRYFPERHLNALIKRGKSLRASYGETFQKIEQAYGVDINMVLAIWGRETAFGAAKNRYDGVRTLLSLAYAGPPEKRRIHRANLLRALKFIDQGHISIKEFKTSFAGATGYPQFTPDVFDQYAVDFDGDGRKNIWSSIPDAVASAAKYLKGIGWQSGQTWGYEVKVPQEFDCWDEGPKGRKPISEWIKHGVERVNNADGTPRRFKDKSLKAQFMAPAGMLGPKFLVLENFEVFRRYNKADLYALFVGHLGDRLGCYKSEAACSFQSPWPKTDNFNFTRKRICEMQIHMKRLGASDETPDGLFGGKTRRGIGTYEKQRGKSPTCFPSKELFQSLRKEDPLPR